MPSKRKKNKRRMRRVQAQRRALEEQYAANPPIKASPGIAVGAPPTAAPKKPAKTTTAVREKIPHVVPATVPTLKTPKVEPRPAVREPAPEPVPVEVEAPAPDVVLLEQTSAELEVEVPVEVEDEAPTFVTEVAPVAETPPLEASTVEAAVSRDTETLVPETEPVAEVIPPAEAPVVASAETKIQTVDTAVIQTETELTPDDGKPVTETEATPAVEDIVTAVEVEILAEEVGVTEVEVETPAEEVSVTQVEAETPAEEVSVTEVEVETPAEEVSVTEVEAETPAEEVSVTEVEVETPAEEVSVTEVEAATIAEDVVVPEPLKEATEEPVVEELSSDLVPAEVEHAADNLAAETVVGSAVEAVTEISGPEQVIEAVSPAATTERGEDEGEVEEEAAEAPADPAAAAEDAPLESVESPVVPDSIPEAPVEQTQSHTEAEEVVADSMIDDFVVTESVSDVEKAVTAFPVEQQEIMTKSEKPSAQTESTDETPADPEPPAAAPAKEVVTDAAAEQTCQDVLSEEPKPELCGMPCQMQLPVESAQLSAVEMSVETALNGHIVPEVSIEG